MRKNLAICGLLAALAAGGMLSGCNDADGQTTAEGRSGASDPIPVTVAPVSFGSLPRTVSVVGTIYGDDEVSISAKVPGRIVDIYADVGDRVSAGQALAQIDPVDYELVIDQREMALNQVLASLGLTELPPPDFDVSTIATVERARFQAANSLAKLNRARQLFAQKPPLISEQDFADLETAYEVAVRDHEIALLEARAQLATARSRYSELEAARQRLADTTVRAPQASLTTTQPSEGQFGVTQRLVSIGEYVREGDAMFRLVADDPVKLRAAVPERYVADVKVGQKVEVRVEGRRRAFEGKVHRINPAIDIDTRTFQIEVLIANPKRELRPGAFARASIHVGEHERVVFVPRDAIVSFAGTTRVFSVDNGKVVEHRVTPMVREEEGPVPIDQALEGVQEVIVTNTSRLAAGMAVVVE